MTRDNKLTPNEQSIDKACNVQHAPIATAQPFFCEGSEAMVNLEAMVDRVGLANVLYALSSICNAKSEHLATNWQDYVAARIWERRSARVRKLAQGMCE